MEKRAYCSEPSISFIRCSTPQKKPRTSRACRKTLEKTQSAQNPKADVKVRASETKKSCSNPVPSSTKLYSEPTKPVTFDSLRR